MRVGPTTISLLALAGAACGGGAEEQDSQRLRTGEYTVMPGEESYLCYTFRSPADREVAITDIEVVAAAAQHHVALFQTAPEEQEGSFECPELVRLNWVPIFAGGTGSPRLNMPEGVGMKIAPDTQYLVQLHLLNATDEPVTGDSEIVLDYAPRAETAELESAGIFALGTFDINIPPGAVDETVTVGCELDRDLNVFAVFPHMHLLGTEITFDRGPSESELERAYSLDPWPFDDQPMDPVDWELKAGDYIQTTCHWNNPTAETVTFGESTNDEMCFFVLFQSPANALDGCVQGT